MTFALSDINQTQAVERDDPIIGQGWRDTFVQITIQLAITGLACVPCLCPTHISLLIHYAQERQNRLK